MDPNVRGTWGSPHCGQPPRALSSSTKFVTGNAACLRLFTDAAHIDMAGVAQRTCKAQVFMVGKLGSYFDAMLWL